MPEITLTDHELLTLYGALRSRLNALSLTDIRNTVAAAGIDITQLPAGADAQRRAAVMPSIDRAFGRLEPSKKLTALAIVAEHLRMRGEEVEADVQALLGKHGFQYIAGSFVPVGLLDAREAAHLPTRCASELARAAARLADGDVSGAITSASGAVDLATQHVYETKGLGSPGRDSFLARVNRSFAELSIATELQSELTALGIADKDAKEIATHTLQSCQHAAEALQVLRRAMGDTHGSRPALAAVAYDAVKMSSAICGLLVGKVA